ncbi:MULTISPECIES: hypothetical protein [unclassified Streptomyces]|uniref:hypothetical protein n=1 Tax=unclassified Streptomyces TaxID=2593676 RepID=UPI003646AFF3
MDIPAPLDDLVRDLVRESGLTTFLTTRAAPNASRLIEDTVALVAGLPSGAGDDIALLALSVPHQPTTDQPVSASTARTLSAAPIPSEGAARVEQEQRP